MNTVFPLMPWKNYTQGRKKKKTKRNSDFLHIYKKKKKKPLNLRTREVEQPLMVEWKGISARPAVHQSVPSHGEQESAALVANTGLARRGLGLEPLSSSAAWCPDDPWG